MKIPSEHDSEAKKREYSDSLLIRAIQRMENAKIPAAIIFDRIATVLAFHSAANFGTAHTSLQFRKMAANIDAGALAKLMDNVEQVH